MIPRRIADLHYLLTYYSGVYSSLHDILIALTPMSQKKNKPRFSRIPGRITLVIVLSICTTGLLLISFISNKKEVLNQTTNVVNQLMNATPTQYPLQELTIPYLRSRSYISALSARTKISDSSSYTSYSTSYDSDGLTIYGLLTIPKSENQSKKWPAIVFVHGYIPPHQYKTQSNYGAYVDYLARNGFVVFKIDLRGHDQSEGEATGAYFSSDYVIDALNARAALQSSDFVDPRAVGLWGHSMAGNVLLRAFATQPDIPAVVIWAGAVYSYQDMLSYGIQDTSYVPAPSLTNRSQRRQKIREIYGDYSATSSFWQHMAPTNYLSDIKGAISIFHAIDDPVVSINYSRDLVKLLNTTSVVHELHEYTTGGHNITGDSFSDAMQKTVAFFQKHLITIE